VQIEKNERNQELTKNTCSNKEQSNPEKCQRMVFPMENARPDCQLSGKDPKQTENPHVKGL
jgi:methionyl-tRNA synthetase